MLNIVFPFVTSVYVARVLLADSIGKVAAAQNFVSYFTLLAGMGIPTYGVKLIAQYKIRSRESSIAFSELFFINFLLSAVCSAIYYILIFTVPYFDGKEVLYAVCGLNIVFNIFNVDWFYQGIQEYRYIAIRSFIFKCLSLIALVCFVRKPQDYIMYALITSCALVGNYIFNMFRITRYTTITLKELCFSEHLRHISALFLAGVASEIYVLADTTMLDILCGSSIVGYYTMSMRVIRIIRGLVVAVSAVFLPQMSYYYYNGQAEKFQKLSNQGIHILTVLSVPAAFGVFLVAEEATVLFYGVNFLDSILTTKILTLSIITIAFSNFVGLQFFVTIGKNRFTTISTICGAVTNIALNFLLIRPYRHVGAAIASVITEGVVAMIQLLMARRYIKFRFPWKNVSIATGCMIACVIIIKTIKMSLVLHLFLECCMGMLTYFIVLIVLKDDFVLNVCKSIRNHNR